MTIVDGAAFALDAPASVASIWGNGSRVLWAQGEPLMIAGPDGVGKTTLGQQIALRRAGIGQPDLLGYPVTPDPHGLVLYLALDRPQQAARSMRRMIDESNRIELESRLIVWTGQLPFDVVSAPQRLVEFAQECAVGTIVIDSLKDLADKLSDEAAGSAINRTMQLCVGTGIEVLSLHHQRKAQAENRKPRALADVYGSRWLTAGCGSVLMLWGEAGDPIVALTHLKQPAEEIGPLTLEHDNWTGSTMVAHAAPDVLDVLRSAGQPLTAKAVASKLFRVPEPKENDLAKAKRRLRAAEAEGAVRRIEPKPGDAALWALGDRVDAEGGRGWTRGADGEGGRSAPIGGASTPDGRRAGQGWTADDERPGADACSTSLEDHEGWLTAVIADGEPEPPFSAVYGPIDADGQNESS